MAWFNVRLIILCKQVEGVEVKYGWIFTNSTNHPKKLKRPFIDKQEGNPMTAVQEEPC